MEVTIKYLKGSYGAANRRGCLNEFLFYLSLKRVNTHGKVLFGDSIGNIKGLTNYSNGAICKTLKSCIAKGFIKTFKDKKGIYCYQLVSYKYCYRKLLGMKFRCEKDSLPEKLLKRIKFDFIDSVKKLKLIVQTIELQFNIECQNYMHNRNEKKKSHFAKRKEHVLVEVMLSCNRISKILGYKTKSSVVSILKRLEKATLVNVTKTGIQSFHSISYSDYCSSNISYDHSFINKMAYKYGCNLLSVSVSHLALHLKMTEHRFVSC